MAAASSGSARVLRAILDKANIADELMMPIRMHALHEAAKNGHVEVIQVLSIINYIIAHFVVTLTFGFFRHKFLCTIFHLSVLLRHISKRSVLSYSFQESSIFERLSVGVDKNL